METFEYLYRQLARTTMAALYVTLGSLVLALLFALLGLQRAVVGLNGVTVVLACASAALLAAFLLTAVVGALVRWLNRRGNAPAK